MHLLIFIHSTTALAFILCRAWLSDPRQACRQPSTSRIAV